MKKAIECHVFPGAFVNHFQIKISIFSYHLLLWFFMLQAFHNGQGQQNTSVILQQILDLGRLQLADRKSTSFLIRVQEQTDIPSSKCSTSQRLDDDLDENSQNSLGICSDLEQMDSSKQELKIELFPSPFSQLEQLSPSTVGIPLHGDTFWQCKSPTQSSQVCSSI